MCLWVQVDIPADHCFKCFFIPKGFYYKRLIFQTGTVLNDHSKIFGIKLFLFKNHLERWPFRILIYSDTYKSFKKTFHQNKAILVYANAKLKSLNQDYDIWLRNRFDLDRYKKEINLTEIGLNWGKSISICLFCPQMVCYIYEHQSYQSFHKGFSILQHAFFKI